MSERRLDVYDGKYTLVWDDETGHLQALRYGEPWRDLVGDGLVLALFQEVEGLRKKLAKPCLDPSYGRLPDDDPSPCSCCRMRGRDS